MKRKGMLLITFWLGLMAMTQDFAPSIVLPGPGSAFAEEGGLIQGAERFLRGGEDSGRREDEEESSEEGEEGYRRFGGEREGDEEERSQERGFGEEEGESEEQEGEESD